MMVEVTIVSPVTTWCGLCITFKKKKFKCWKKIDFFHPCDGEGFHDNPGYCLLHRVVLVCTMYAGQQFQCNPSGAMSLDMLPSILGTIYMFHSPNTQGYILTVRILGVIWPTVLTLHVLVLTVLTPSVICLTVLTLWGICFTILTLSVICLTVLILRLICFTVLTLGDTYHCPNTQCDICLIILILGDSYHCPNTQCDMFHCPNIQDIYLIP